MREACEGDAHPSRLIAVLKIVPVLGHIGPFSKSSNDLRRRVPKTRLTNQNPRKRCEKPSFWGEGIVGDDSIVPVPPPRNLPKCSTFPLNKKTYWINSREWTYVYVSHVANPIARKKNPPMTICFVLFRVLSRPPLTPSPLIPRYWQNAIPVDQQKPRNSQTPNHLPQKPLPKS